MLRRMRMIVAMVGVTLMVASAASAQESSESAGTDVRDQLRTLIDEVKGLRSDNTAMREEIDELRAATRDDWLTERRADEIRGIVQDVLADADTRASFQTDGLIAGWSDQFFLAGWRKKAASMGGSPGNGGNRHTDDPVVLRVDGSFRHRFGHPGWFGGSHRGAGVRHEKSLPKSWSGKMVETTPPGPGGPVVV